MAAAHAAPRCQAWLPDGRRCACPALRGRRRCRFHLPVFKPQRRSYPLPILEDAASIHLALLQVTRAVAEDGMSPGQARLLLYALQLAASNLKNLSTPSPGHSITQSPSQGVPVEWQASLRAQDDSFSLP
jgi:hypothetical protein